MRIQRALARWGLLAAPLVVLAGYGCLSPDDPLDPDILAALADTDCTQVDATYENFMQAFCAKYCLSCHSETLVGDVARTDAPQDIDFDTLDDIRSFATRIRLRTGELGDMPPRLFVGGAIPTLEERIKLIQWIDCGLPSEADP